MFEYVLVCLNCIGHQHNENITEQMNSSGNITELCLRSSWF